MVGHLVQAAGLLQEAALAALEERLDGLMEVVRLSYLIKREGGWGAVCEWGETLSLGSPVCRAAIYHTFAKRASTTPASDHAR